MSRFVIGLIVGMPLGAVLFMVLLFVASIVEGKVHERKRLQMEKQRNL